MDTLMDRRFGVICSVVVRLKGTTERFLLVWVTTGTLYNSVLSLHVTLSRSMSATKTALGSFGVRGNG